MARCVRVCACMRTYVQTECSTYLRSNLVTSSIPFQSFDFCDFVCTEFYAISSLVQ